MFVGHIAAGLALKRAEPRLNLGLLVLGAEFADCLLWVLVLAGVESILPAQPSGSARFFSFVFPYSHGLAASVLWSLLAGAAVWGIAPATARRRVFAWVMTLAVFSHFVLDFIVHVPDLPLLSEASPKMGLGLWRHMPVALALEMILTAAATVFFLQGTRLPRRRRWLAITIIGVAAALTLAGPYMPGDPPPPGLMAGSSLATLIVVVLLAFAVEGSLNVVTNQELRHGDR